MTTPHDTWQEAVLTAQVIITRQNAKTEALVQELGLAAGGVLLFYALDFAPEPLAVSRLHQRMPYTSPLMLEKALNALEKEGWLTRAPKRSYTLTTKAHDALAHILKERLDELAALQTLPEDELTHLATLLESVVETALSLPEPPAAHGLRQNRNSAVPADSPPLARIVQSFSDLSAFWEDCSRAAWQPLIAEGYVWEALSLIAQNSAGTAAELAQQLSSARGYAERDYAKAIHVLIERGWIELLAEEAVITEAGEQVRQQAADQTQAYFFAAWHGKSEAELTTMSNLLTQLRTMLVTP